MKNQATSCLLSVLLVLSSSLLTPQAASAAEQRHAAAHFGLGVATAVVNLIYGPVKVVYAVTGSLVGGLAWMITGGRRDIAAGIIQPAVRGDYALVPENLTMAQPYSFVGHVPDPEY